MQVCKIISYQIFKGKAQKSHQHLGPHETSFCSQNSQYLSRKWFFKQKQTTKGFYWMSKTAWNSKRELSFDCEKIIGAGFHSSHNQRATLFRNECKQT